MPLALIDCASSASRSAWKTRRGCCGLIWISSTDTVSAVSPGCGLASSGGSATGAAGGACVRVESRAFRPLPSTLRGFSLLFMVEDLFRELNIAFSAFRARIVRNDRLSETRSLRQPHATRNHRRKHFGTEEFLQIVRDLPGQVGPVVKHRQQDSFDLQRMFERGLDAVD